MNLHISIGQQTFFNNGELLLPLLKGNATSLLKDIIQNDWLNFSREFTTVSHKKKESTYQGIKADELNRVLRQAMVQHIPNVNGETFAENGALYHKGKKGFDFALYDEKYNIVQIRNSFIGNPGRYNGEQGLIECYKYTKFKKSEWKKQLESLKGEKGANILAKKEKLTVVGELQFGNWALAKNDLLRLTNSVESLSIDYYIYITAAGNLEKKLSEGIVSYSKAVSVVTENLNRIKTPIWIIGLDCSDVE